MSTSSSTECAWFTRLLGATLICTMSLLMFASLSSANVSDAIASAAKKADISEDLLSAICWVESRHNPKAVHHDDGGTDSIGLCQIKLATARWMGYRGSAKGLYDPRTNAHFAAQYVKYLLRRHSNCAILAISAYNSGTPKYRNGKLINEKYVERVISKSRGAVRRSCLGPAEQLDQPRRGH